MNVGKPSICAVLLTAVGLSGLVGIPASGASGTEVPAEMGSTVTNVADCPGTPIAGYDLAADPFGVQAISEEIGAGAYYAAGLAGQGIDVAVIDSGVAEVDGFDNDNLVHGPDLSFESQAAFADDPDERNDDLAYADTYGHGTHMAGIIAGRDNAKPANWKNFDYDDPEAFRGIAPGARVVSVKVADAMGATDVTQMLAAIDWVVQNKNKNGLNIRVLNLSVGIASFGKYQTNVLTYATEVAWKAGIVVVVAAGNGGHAAGPGANPMPMPASNPNVIAVGSYDTKGTIGKGEHADDTSSDFTQAGTATRSVDVTAPGEHVMSLHVRGSHSDDEIAHDCLSGVQHDGSWSSPVAGPDERFVRGSGTSQSAAIVSGAVALMLSKTPSLTPDMVREKIMKTARPLCFAHSRASDGRGELNLSDDNMCVRGNGTGNAADRGRTFKLKNFAPAKGGGTLNNARGPEPLPCTTTHSTKLNRFGAPIPGASPSTRAPGLCKDVWDAYPTASARAAAMERDIHGFRINTKGTGELTLTGRERNHKAWTVDSNGDWHWMGGPAWYKSAVTVAGRPTWPTKQWNSDWMGVRWSANDWSGARWSGARWSGVRWSESSWSGVRWSSDALSGVRWSGARWSGATWQDHRWA